MRKRLITFLLGIHVLFCCGITVLASPAAEAEDMSSNVQISGSGYERFDFLFDGDLLTTHTSSGDVSISVYSEEDIGYLYLIFDMEYPGYVIENIATGSQVRVEGYGCLHECIDLSQYFDQLPTAVTIHFEGSVSLNELTVYSEGILPEHVQQWSPPAEGKTDILLLSTHGDDEQLFFAGLLPLYAGERDATVQVAYLTDHRNLTSERVHEMLNGLWAVGCDVYPVFGSFADFRVDDLQKTYQTYRQLGVTEDDLLEFTVEQLRRFRPQVVVGHDIQGEYGHGMHMVYSDCLIQALDASSDDAQFPELAEKYGVWEVPKTYLHLYEDNPIVIDYDQPLSRFDGLTAFEVTQQLGFPCHKTQQYTWFTGWLYGKSREITKASQIRTYNPCQFGLYRSTVGPDLLQCDFLENITTYAEQEQIRLEQERLEQERLEQERLEQERLEQERLEQERLEQEQLEQERLEQEQLEQEQENKKHRRMIAIVLLSGSTVVLLLIISIHRKKRP